MNSEKNLKDKKKKNKIGRYFIYDFVKITGIVPALILLRPKIYYPEGKHIPKGRVLISSNHHTLIDPIIVMAAFWNRRLNCLATKDLYRMKIMNFFLNACHCIQVDKDNFTMASFHQVVDRLNEEKAVLIFPEGQVSTGQTSSILTFKSGVILMAHKSGAPVIPMYIVRRRKLIHRQEIVIGAPVDIRGMVGTIPSMDDITRASEYLREKEVELKAFYEEKINKNK